MNMEIESKRVKKLEVVSPYYYKNSQEAYYVISGMIEFMNVENYEVFKIKKDEKIILSTGCGYARKIKKGTSYLHISDDSNPIKINVPIDNIIEKWLCHPIHSKRVDYFYSTDAPKPNRLIPAATACMLDEKKRLLLLRRKDNLHWTVPGGTMHLDETLEEALIREVREETGLEIGIIEIIKIYSNPNIIIEYTDGEVRREFNVLYFSKIKEGKIQLDNESTEYKWVPLNDVLNYEFTSAQRIRILDVVEYLKSKEF